MANRGSLYASDLVALHNGPIDIGGRLHAAADMSRSLWKYCFWKVDGHEQ